MANIVKPYRHDEPIKNWLLVIFVAIGIGLIVAGAYTGTRAFIWFGLGLAEGLLIGATFLADHCPQAEREHDNI